MCEGSVFESSLYLSEQVHFGRNMHIEDEHDGLKKLQLEKLTNLLKEIYPSNSFYRHKLDKSGFKISDLDEGGTLEELLEKLPFTEKSELQADQEKFPPYGSNLTYELDCYRRIHRTSGTTGAPIYWLDTADSWQWFIDCWKKVYVGVGLEKSDRIFFPFSFGPFIGFWGAFEAGLQLGNFCLAGGGMSSVGRLAYLLEHEITVVCCTPTYALHLAEVAEENSIELSGRSVRLLVVAGEPGGLVPGTRKRIAGLWGAEVRDHHGMTEIGCVTYESRESPGALCPLEEDFIIEVVKPGSSEEVEAGDAGELVLTNLGRSGSPLLRYRTGDMVRLKIRDGQGGAGRGADLKLFDGGVLGRADDMFFVRGNNVYPTAIETVIREFREVAEYRLRVVESGDLNSLEVDIEPAGSAGEDDSAALEELPGRIAKALHDALLFRVRVRLVERGSLPRHELKARRLVREKDNQ